MRRIARMHPYKLSVTVLFGAMEFAALWYQIRVR